MVTTIRNTFSKQFHILKNFCLVIVFLAIQAVGFVNAQPMNATLPEIEELFQRTYGLLSAAKFCQDKPSFDRAGLALKQIINYAKRKYFKVRSIEIFQNDPEGMINKGAKNYGEQHWITCKEVEHYSNIVYDFKSQF